MPVRKGRAGVRPRPSSASLRAGTAPWRRRSTLEPARRRDMPRAARPSSWGPAAPQGLPGRGQVLELPAPDRRPGRSRTRRAVTGSNNLANYRLLGQQRLYQRKAAREAAWQNLPEAHKLHLASDRTSCTRACANQVLIFWMATGASAARDVQSLMPKRSPWRVAQFDTLRTGSSSSSPRSPNGHRIVPWCSRSRKSLPSSSRLARSRHLSAGPCARTEEPIAPNNPPPHSRHRYRAARTPEDRKLNYREKTHPIRFAGDNPARARTSRSPQAPPD